MSDGKTLNLTKASTQFCFAKGVPTIYCVNTQTQIALNALDILVLLNIQVANPTVNEHVLQKSISSSSKILVLNMTLGRQFFSAIKSTQELQLCEACETIAPEKFP